MDLKEEEELGFLWKRTPFLTMKEPGSGEESGGAAWGRAETSEASWLEGEETPRAARS